MFTKTAFQREEAQVCTKSQLNHIESRVGKESLKAVVHVFYTDCETIAVKAHEDEVGPGNRKMTAFPGSSYACHGSPLLQYVPYETSMEEE